MPQQKYAIICSTEEQARECDSKKLLRYTLGNWYKFSHDTFGMYMLSKFNLEGYTIITYEVAIEKGLLGEKKTIAGIDFSEQLKFIEPQQNEVHKTQEEITADEQMEINEMINEESPSEEYSMEEAESDIQECIGISKYAIGIPSEEIKVIRCIEPKYNNNPLEYECHYCKKIIKKDNTCAICNGFRLTKPTEPYWVENIMRKLYQYADLRQGGFHIEDDELIEILKSNMNIVK